MTIPLGRPGRMQPGNRPETWRGRFQAMRHVPRLLKLVWQTAPRYAVGVLLLRLMGGAIPIGMLWIGKLIVDGVVVAVEGRAAGIAADWHYLALLLAGEFGLALLATVASRTTSLLESLLGDLFANETSVRLMRHAALLDLEQLEDADIYDRLERARRQTVGRLALVTLLLGTVQDLVTLASITAAVAIYVPWLLLLLLIAVLPSFLGETHYASLGYSLVFSWTPQRRQLDYLRYIGASDISAKELKLFGLSEFFVGRYDKLSREFYEANRRLSIKRSSVSVALNALGTLGYYAAYAIIIYLAVIQYRSPAGIITIGTLTFLAASFRQSRDLLQRVLLALAQVYEQSLYLDDLFGFFEIVPRMQLPDAPLPVPMPIRTGFVFDNVGFRYAGQERWAVRGLSFTLAPGERLALVGENGAGKTTLAKLLVRLYDPSEGRILLDGVDLREYDVESLRRNAGVIFQDFVRYDFMLSENVAVGDINRLDDEALVREAARRSLADSVAERVGGYGRMLGRRFEGGADLSGGEWQKVALARAYMRDAQLLVLDEPTAALDARAEYEVFLRFSELTKGKMAVLISHRFSTVRMADRILVLQAGQLIEEGTHDALVAAAGVYADLFQLQAAGYR
ncbi:MAG TPA: ABC transporter ATP-binding protein [Gemmatimonadales bacterium]|jgi:ATP-binding cassette subfamily B protein|nr:ABC transporter ATP-binding protein [Gemmatimonadales bacterium]